MIIPNVILLSTLNLVSHSDTRPTSSHSAFLLAHSIVATLAAFLSLDHTKFFPVSRPLHLPFSVPAMLFSWLFPSLASYS